MFIEDYPNHAKREKEDKYLLDLTALLYLCTVETHKLATDSTQDCMGQNTHDIISLRTCAEKRLSVFTEVLSTINLTPSSFVDLYLSMMHGEHTLTNLSKERSFKANPNTHLRSEEKELCERVAIEYVKNLNLETKPVGSSKIYVFAGPTAAGKTEALENMQDNIDIPEDAITIDLDLIRPLLMEGYVASNQDHIASTRALSWYTSDLIATMVLEKNYSLVIQSPLHRLERVLRDPTFIYARDHNIPIVINYVLRPVVDCFLRSLHRERGILIEDLIASMEGIKHLSTILESYPNIEKLNLIDFYPYFRKIQGILPSYFLDEYYNLLSYLQDKDKVTIYRKKTNYPVVNN